jgi:hypothetical protein
MTTKALNSGLLVMVGLPLFAILASVGVAVVAFTRGDPTLPDEYHWEGLSLDRDFADARRAADLNVRATVQVWPGSGICRVTIQLNAASPSGLTLNLVHATHPDLDRQIRLPRTGSVYEGQCGVIPSGHWHLELSDGTGSWSVRQEVVGALDGISITARADPGAPGMS